MLYGLLVTGYTFVCILLVLIILIQKGKGSSGLGAIGGGSQMLFGGSGGQDIFQKITWILGAIFIFGSLALSLIKTSQSQSFRYAKSKTTQSLPVIPQEKQ
jgi:protein translocase SecG subunit